MDTHRIPAAGDPFTVAPRRDTPHACNDGWVSVEVETDDGSLEEVLYLCRRCLREGRDE